jgi:acetyl esterase/lipase
MGLDADCAAIVSEFADAPPFEAMTVEQARELIMGYLPLMGEPEPVASVEDRALPGPDAPVAVRVYTPGAETPPPVVVYLHGGGWASGNIELTDPLCRILANRSGCAFVSVDYRLAPEHPFPAALEDAYAATAWIAEHGAEIGVDPHRLAVMGDSSGGNLAAGVTLLSRERGGPEIALQVLVYPSVAGNSPETSSHAQYGEGYIIGTRGFEWFWNHYTGGVEPEAGSYARPLDVEDLSGLPPAFLLTAECDPLRDEGDAYAERLAAAGVPVDHRPYAGTMHGFLYMPAAVAKAREAIDEISRTLRRALALQAA